MTAISCVIGCAKGRMRGGFKTWMWSMILAEFAFELLHLCQATDVALFAGKF
jgi:hypothetical protein